MNPELVLNFAGGFLCALKSVDVHDGYVADLNNLETSYILEWEF